MAGSHMSGLFDFWKREERPKAPALPPIHVNLYEILGVSPKASHDEIRRNFRELSSKFHPDRNPNDPVAERRYAEITEAYTILSDPAQRAAYDRIRETPAKPSKKTQALILPGKKERVVEEETPSAPQKRVVPKWEALFAPSKERGKPIMESFREMVRPGSVSRPSPTPFSRRTEVVEIPTPNELYSLLQHWPLEGIWEVVRNERTSMAFREAGAVAVDTVAGTSGQPLEYDIADLFSISQGQIDAFIRNKGRDALFQEVFYPLFDAVTLVLQELKPSDIPGRFFLDWDPTRRMIEVVYVEDIGRRPWK